VPSANDTNFQQYNSRSRHVARDDIARIQVAFANFYVLAGHGQELVPDTVADITASIEYPEGVFTQLLFSGVASKTIPRGEFVVSDLANVVIPDGTAFWVREFRQQAQSILYNVSLGPNANDALELAASGLTDMTMGGTITAGFAVTTATKFMEGYAQRQLLFKYCTHLVVEYGTVDFSLFSLTVDQLKAVLSRVYDVFPTRRVFQTTITPISSSTDGWVTAVNQTPNTQGGRIGAFNADLRSSAFGPGLGMLDVAAVLQDATDETIWKSTGGTARTGDGLHPNTFGNNEVASSGVIDPDLFIYP
jgi:hypothetical protein